MNYFGHAAIASERETEPGFIFGAMLPDLCAMAGLRGEETLDGSVGRGVQFHLATDALFHQTRVFCQHNRRLQSRFRELGVARGPARAGAHLGVEMLIDAELANEDLAVRGYLAGLQFGVDGMDQQVEGLWGFVERMKLTGLCRLLLDRGPSIHSTAHERFVERLGRALRGRRLLAPTADELQVMARELHGDDGVRSQVPELLEELSPLLRG